MLSVMAKGFFEQSSLLFFPVAALFVFIAAFTVITVRALRADSESIQQLAGLPLAGDIPQVVQESSDRQ